MVSNVILILVIVFSVMLGGLFSGAETGMYQLSRLRLRLGIEKKKLSFVILAKVLRDSGGLLISMLVGTNLSNYLATSIATYLLLARFEAAHTAEIAAAFLITPVSFVFSELLPKSIFFYRADSAMPLVAPVLLVFHKLFTWLPIVPLLKSVSGFFTRLAGGAAVGRTSMAALRLSHIKAVFHETREEALLSPVQTGIVNRVANISDVIISSVMTPFGRIRSVGFDCDRGGLLNGLKKWPFTRLLVYRDSPGNITGFVNVYDCLTRPEAFANLGDFLQPIRKMTADTVVIDAINIMQAEGLKIVLVTKAGHSGREKAVGIVTMKALAEELLGELSEW